ncbi:MAG: hypothetical protein ACLS8R_00015 [Anaeromassilibacillus sp.]
MAQPKPYPIWRSRQACGTVTSNPKPDLIICSTIRAATTPPVPCPEQAGAFRLDINAACSGFLYVGRDWRVKVLLIAGDVKLLDWKDRRTCVLFGDGAVAVVGRGDGLPPSALRHPAIWTCDRTRKFAFWRNQGL